jgi:hypothetical protein
MHFISPSSRSLYYRVGQDQMSGGVSSKHYSVQVRKLGIRVGILGDIAPKPTCTE